MTPEQAEAAILSRELFGMRFGLERMRRLMTALGHPERRYRTIHVVGTNGKSSTVRMAAELLSRHGLRSGAYLSPHLTAYAERIRIEGADLTPERFAAGVARVLAAATKVERTCDEPVTQFELLTAAAFCAFADAEVDVAVIEAGLGGRFDATNVIPSSVAVLTGVGLEHTRWLGPTHAAIAREKVEVLQPASPLVIGAGLHPDARRVAEEIAAARGSELLVAPEDPGVAITALGGFQRGNFATARTAVEALLERMGETPLDPATVLAAAGSISVPGRLQVIDTAPLTVLDGAHNPDGIAALAGSLPDLEARRSGGGGRRVAVLSVLDDKDAAGMLAILADRIDAWVMCASHHPRALSPATLASLLGQIGGPEAEIVPGPRAALDRARALAGAGGLVLATGSIYLIADLLAPAGAASPSARSSL